MEYLDCSGDYEKLRAFTSAEKKAAFIKILENLCKEKDNFLLDSHYLTLIRGEISIMTSDSLKNFDGLVLISTPLEVLWQRIEADSAVRDRALFPANVSKDEQKKILAEYQLETLREFNRVVNAYDVPGIHIQNDADNPEKAANLLHEFILGLKK